MDSEFGKIANLTQNTEKSLSLSRFRYTEEQILSDRKKFSEIIQRAMNQYLNGMLTNEEVIQELLKLAGDITAGNEEGESLGLTTEELAFYDALTKPQAIKDFYQHEELKSLTKELTELLRKIVLSTGRKTKRARRYEDTCEASSQTLQISS